ncbi:MAG: hypothetical protein ACR2PA_04330, partial [Hyphomicrobiaceae bacterium]
ITFRNDEFEIRCRNCDFQKFVPADDHPTDPVYICAVCRQQASTKSELERMLNEAEDWVFAPGYEQHSLVRRNSDSL